MSVILNSGIFPLISNFPSKGNEDVYQNSIPVPNLTNGENSPYIGGSPAPGEPRYLPSPSLTVGFQNQPFFSKFSRRYRQNFDTDQTSTSTPDDEGIYAPRTQTVEHSLPVASYVGGEPYNSYGSGDLIYRPWPEYLSLSIGGYATSGYSNFSVLSNLYYGFTGGKFLIPQSFRTSRSFFKFYGVDYTDPENPVSESPIKYSLDNLFIIRDRYATWTKNVFVNRSYASSIDPFTATLSMYINYTFNPEAFDIKIKLLTKSDADFCEIALASDVGASFFDDLESPTLEEAIASGGCQYFGILKHMVPLYNSFTINFEATDDGYYLGPTFYPQCQYGAEIDYRGDNPIETYYSRNIPQPAFYDPVGYEGSYTPEGFRSYAPSNIDSYFIVLSP